MVVEHICIDCSFYVVICCFSVPLFCHMSAPTQRLMLSFIYIHREHIPLSALKDFVDALFTDASILPTSGWIRMLLEMLITFCSARMKVCLDERYSRGRFDIGTKHDEQKSESPVCRENADNVSSDFSLLNDIIQHRDNGSSLLGPYCQNSCFNDQQTELVKESDVFDMNTEMSVEFFDTDIIAATVKLDGSVNVLSQQQIGIVMFYYIVLNYILYDTVSLITQKMSELYFSMTDAVPKSISVLFFRSIMSPFLLSAKNLNNCV